MKALILTALLLASSAQAATRDDLCIAVGSLGQTVAIKRFEGTLEKALLAVPMPDTPVAGISVAGISRAVVRYVYTMQVAPADARKIIYLKCVAGDFGVLK